MTAVDGETPWALDLPLKLTAILLLLRPLDVWWISPAILAGAILAMLFHQVRRQPATWLALSALLALRIAVVWPLSDNHVYLLAYWCLALGLALAGPVPVRAVAAAARWLLGAAFAFAVLWKAVLTPDYLDGRFFRVTLLTDDRFAAPVMLLTGLTPDEIAADRRYLEPLPEGAELARPGLLLEPTRFFLLVVAATSGVLAVEAAVAIGCLLPGVAFLEVLRHAALLAFCAVTYAFAPVAGFGWLLAIMGLAQCRPEQRMLRGAYVGAFFLILAYAEVPWASALGRAMD